MIGGRGVNIDAPDGAGDLTGLQYGDLKLLPEQNVVSGMGLDWIVLVIQGASLLPGDVVWWLYDTHGFPIDLTKLTVT